MRRVVLAVGLLGVFVSALSSEGLCQGRVTGIPDTVATVNGAAVSAEQFVQNLSIQAGEQVLSRLIEQQIIISWAAEEKVEPTKEQIDRQIEMFKWEGIYEDQLKAMGKESLNYELKAMQARINLVKKAVKIDDKEIQSIYDNPMMRNRYVHGPRKRVAVIANSKKEQIDEAAKKLAANEDPDKVATVYAESGRAVKGWVEDDATGAMAVFAEAARSLNAGESSKTFPIVQAGLPAQYAVLKVVQEQPKTDMKFAEVRGAIEDTVALQKFMDLEFQIKLNEKKKAAKIEIKIDGLAGVAGQFKNPPEPNPLMSVPSLDTETEIEQPTKPAAKPKKPEAQPKKKPAVKSSKSGK